MPPKYISAALALGLAFMAGTSMAQDSTAPASPPAMPTKDTATVGQVYLAETAAPWELRCTKTETGKDPCQIFQLLRGEDGSGVVEFNIFEIPNGNGAAAGALVVVPLETQLETGLVIQIDEHDPRSYPFAYCNGYGCIARVGFTAEELGWMKAGSQAVITIVPALAPTIKVTPKLSLSGFTDMIAKTKAPE